MESDPMGLAFITPAIVAQSFHPLSLYLGATFQAPPLNILLGATVTELLSFQSAFAAQAAAEGSLQPIGMYATVNGIIPQQPQVAFEAGQIVSKVPLLIGTNRDEGITFTLKLFASPLNPNGYIAALAGLFGPTAAQIIGTYYPPNLQVGFDNRQQLAHIVTDAGFYCPSKAAAFGYSKVQSNVYYYKFNHGSVFPDPLKGFAYHGSELAYTFDEAGLFFPTEAPLATAISKSFAAFVKYQNPNTAGTGLTYPKLTSKIDGDKIIEIDTVSTLGVNDNAALCAFWTQAYAFYPISQIANTIVYPTKAPTQTPTKKPTTEVRNMRGVEKV